MVNKKTNKNNDSRKIVTMIAIIFALVLCITGATYAYFAITAPSNNSITGTAATASLILTDTTGGTTDAAPALIAPTNATYISSPLVPQYSYRSATNILQKALVGAGTDKCVDGNGNAVCRAYTFVVKNQSTAAINVKGKLKFQYSGTDSKFDNLRWKLMDSATNVTVSSDVASDVFSTTAPIKASNDYIYFDTTTVSLNANGGYKQYWLIFWIEESGTDQNATDKGNFNVDITFDVYDVAGNVVSGLTSTITT